MLHFYHMLFYKYITCDYFGMNIDFFSIVVTEKITRALNENGESTIFFDDDYYFCKYYRQEWGFF